MRVNLQQGPLILKSLCILYNNLFFFYLLLIKKDIENIKVKVSILNMHGKCYYINTM